MVKLYLPMTYGAVGPHPPRRPQPPAASTSSGRVRRAAPRPNPQRLRRSRYRMHCRWPPGARRRRPLTPDARSIGQRPARPAGARSPGCAVTGATPQKSGPSASSNHLNVHNGSRSLLRLQPVPGPYGSERPLSYAAVAEGRRREIEFVRDAAVHDREFGSDGCTEELLCAHRATPIREAAHPRSR
jgi:hypothetical protein